MAILHHTSGSCGMVSIASGGSHCRWVILVPFGNGKCDGGAHGGASGPHWIMSGDVRHSRRSKRGSNIARLRWWLVRGGELVPKMDWLAHWAQATAQGLG